MVYIYYLGIAVLLRLIGSLIVTESRIADKITVEPQFTEPLKERKITLLFPTYQLAVKNMAT